ncbi:MAG TPA: aminotransferase class V-fold PLP-dependent enzyme [bacterium]|nr:aminotransferase class V-fold PLP-dependent enzyme [bacterium]
MERRHFLSALTAACTWALSPHHRIDARTLNHLKDDPRFWALVRKQFAFPEGYTYLNTGGIGPLPAMVRQCVKTAMDRAEIRPKPGHDMDTWLQIKEKAARIFDCEADSLALTGTATEGINIIINGLPLKREDEIITSSHEHPALNIALLNRMQRDGIVIQTFEPDLNEGLKQIESIGRLLSRRTRLVFISHVTCTTGQCFPIREIANLVHRHGAWLALDGAQSVGALPVSMQDIDADFYAVSGHKWLLGPRRTGILYVRPALLDTLRPVTVGAYSDDGYDLQARTLKLHPTARRYEFATQNEALFIGLGEAMDFIQAISIPRIWEHNRVLSETFYHGLKQIHGIRILSPAEPEFRSSMITFSMDRLNYRDASAALGKMGFRVRVVSEGGLEAVRVSFHVCNGSGDVTRLLNAVETLARRA